MGKKMISLEISDELREALRVEAFKRSLSISALMRQLLEEALKLPKEVDIQHEQNG
jgi:plasmid stability protein